MKTHEFDTLMDDLYSSKNPLVKFVHLGRLRTITNLIKTSNLKILDAGCGEGHLIDLLHKKNNTNTYHGIDITESALEQAKKRCPYSNLTVGNLEKTQFQPNFFDIIICTEVLEHIYNYQNIITELKRILKPQGTLIITFPNEKLWTIARFLLGRRPIKEPEHVNSFTPKSMKKLTNMKVTQQTNLPFKLPFFLSLGHIIEFKK